MRYATGVFLNRDGMASRLTLDMAGTPPAVVEVQLPHHAADRHNPATTEWDTYFDGETFDNVVEQYERGDLAEDFETAYAQRTED